MTKNIVLTGGPCGGKSTALADLKKCLDERGYKVFIIEESATKLISQGITPVGDNAIPLYEFQKLIMHYQLLRENIVRAKAKLFKKSIILYDRSTIDNKSYLNEIEWQHLQNELGIEESKLMNRYDQVIHLVTAADGALEYYTLENNNARSETPEEAIKKDKQILRAYLGHPNIKVIDNSTNFKEKIERTINCILSELNEPTYYNNQYKFLVDLEQSNLEKLTALSRKSYIEQTYLISKDNIDRKIRRKITDGAESYYLIEKIKNGNQEEIKTKKIISKLEYLYYLNTARDKTKGTIRKTRYSFTINKEFYNLDIFENDSKWAILENETVKDIKYLQLPEFLNIVEIQEKNELYNIERAKKAFKEENLYQDKSHYINAIKTLLSRRNKHN